jgi:hypothetical protein
MGLDCGFGTSKTGIGVIMLESNKLHVLFSREIEKSRVEDIVSLCNQLRVKYSPQRLFCDAANPEIIRSLKIQWQEPVDFERIISQARADKIDISHRMRVVPVSFNIEGRLLLERLANVISRHLILIPKEFYNLITEIRMARINDLGNLDKKGIVDNNSYDLLDSLRLCVRMFPLKERVK